MAAGEIKDMLQDEWNEVIPKQERRRIMKPITERLRRERINSNLYELKRLVLSAMGEDVSQYSRMEKADILEMTVRYIQHIQKKNILEKDSYDRRPPKDRSPKFRRTAQNGRGNLTQFAANVPEPIASGQTGVTPNEVDRIQLPTPSDVVDASVMRETLQRNNPAQSPLRVSIPSSYGTYPSPTPAATVDTVHAYLTDSKNIIFQPRSEPSFSCSVDFDSVDKLRSPFKVRCDNSSLPVATGRPGPLLMVKETRKTLPGMESFVRSRNFSVANQTNKENQHGDLFESEAQDRLPTQYDSQLYSSLWRPW